MGGAQGNMKELKGKWRLLAFRLNGLQAIGHIVIIIGLLLSLVSKEGRNGCL